MDAPSGPAGAHAQYAPRGAAPAHNPWQREERERQQEQRRAHARSRRDGAIAALLAMGAARSPAQNQQLRALQLERDFERRATQQTQEDTAHAEAVESDRDSASPEPERAPAPPQPPQPLQPPKSILKTHHRPETNGYAQDMSPGSERLAQTAEALGTLSLAPPPPERGSSFAVMATRARALSPPAPAPAPAPATPQPTQPTTPHSPPGGGRDKRVSFHERPAPAPAPAPAAAPPAPPASSPPPLHDAPHEDPDRFIEEASMMMAGGLSPNTPPAALHTPGVIGAQEVYRDPRQRRLAEKQAATAGAAPVPEQLSFKEKMKMFALEAGDPNTPKDKVKISRAQRDIDAVH